MLPLLCCRFDLYIIPWCRVELFIFHRFLCFFAHIKSKCFGFFLRSYRARSGPEVLLPVPCELPRSRKITEKILQGARLDPRALYRLCCETGLLLLTARPLGIPCYERKINSILVRMNGRSNCMFWWTYLNMMPC